MTMGEMKANVLKSMGTYTANVGDENPGQEYEPMLQTMLNDGYAIVCRKYKPVAAKTVMVGAEGRVPLSAFPGLMKVLGVQMETETASVMVPHAISSCGLFLRVCGVERGEEITVAYTHMPEPMRIDAAAPIFKPEILHPVLVEYALYRLMGMYTIGDSQTAKLHFGMYQEMLAQIRPQQDAGGKYLRNKYVPW